MARRIVDLTQEVRTGMQVFPLHSPTHVIPWAPRETFGFAANALFVHEHAGTHLDAPFHFVEEGETIEAIDLERLTGPARVVDLASSWPKGRISASDLDAATADAPVGAGDALLLRTGAEPHLGTPPYLSEYPGLTEDGARWVAERRLRLVGTDAPSIDHPDDPAFPAHHLLLPAGVLVVENLAGLEELVRLAEGGSFTLHTFPLKIRSGTGSPIRAVAVIDGE